mmetsp:Transcript_109758/g.310517  ORF Transcript_109758/g.310517 Transcript_109758/m.310517 type:complete len:268 (-) Transcript_109758:94-897(-)
MSAVPTRPPDSSLRFLPLACRAPDWGRSWWGSCGGRGLPGREPPSSAPPRLNPGLALCCSRCSWFRTASTESLCCSHIGLALLLVAGGGARPASPVPNRGAGATPPPPESPVPGRPRSSSSGRMESFPRTTRRPLPEPLLWVRPRSLTSGDSSASALIGSSSFSLSTRMGRRPPMLLRGGGEGEGDFDNAGTSGAHSREAGRGVGDSARATGASSGTEARDGMLTAALGEARADPGGRPRSAMRSSSPMDFPRALPSSSEASSKSSS